MEYEIKKNTREISFKNRRDIKQGCTINHNDDTFSEIVESFDNKEDAIEALKTYKTNIRKVKWCGRICCQVIEYHVEENEYDENDYWISGGNILGISEMPEIDECFKKWEENGKKRNE